MMNSLIEISLCCLLLFAVYKVVLENTVMHRLKRSILLFCLLFPLAVPFIDLELKENVSPVLTGTNLVTESIAMAISDVKSLPPEPQAYSEDNSPTYKTHFSWSRALLVICGAVSCILLFRFIINLVKLLKKGAKRSSFKRNGCSIVVAESTEVPHNFLNTIFINRVDYENDLLRERLLTHEIAHARQLHSIDIILLELIRVLFWFNPVYYFLGKSIRLNHEYLADAKVIQTHGNTPDYQRLLLAFINRSTEANPQLASFSNYSLTKKRFKMMTQKMSTTAKILRSIALVAMVVLVTSSFVLKPKVVEISTLSVQEPVHSVSGQNTPDILPLQQKDIQRLTSNFGMRKDPITGERKMHLGLDYSAKTGTPVMTTADGMVEKVKEDIGYGKQIQIRHNNTYQTLYAQLSETNVNVGDKVKKGQVIGKVGSTGLSTAPHLHYEVIENGVRVDPRNNIPQDSISRRQPIVLSVLSIDSETQKKYGLSIGHRMINFGSGYKFSKVVYDDEKIVLFRVDQEPIVKNIKELSLQAQSAIKALALPPRPPMAEKPLTNDIVKNWLDPTVYGIWIDGKKVDNSIMSKYEASDFAHYFKSKVYPSTKGYQYQLDLTTRAKLEKENEHLLELKREWERTTKSLLDQIEL